MSGECLRDSYPPGWQFAWRVINSHDGSDVHAVIASFRDLEMPTARRFAYRLDLQMNVPVGNYYVEFFVWDAERSDNVVNGPRVYVEVLERARFHGAAQLNSRWVEVSDAHETIARSAA